MTPQIVPVLIASTAPLPIPCLLRNTSIAFEGMNEASARFISMMIE
jgi:hypothetical protein